MNEDWRLSAKRIGRAVEVAKQKKEFKFVVGKDANEYHCSLVQACFISERVCRLVTNDSTVNTLHVLPDREGDYFDLFERMWNGENVCINTSNAKTILALNEELENEELNQRLIDFSLSNEEISVENALSRIHMKYPFGLSVNDEVEFVSSHFYEFSASDLSILTVNELESILSHESFQIDNENTLLECILELIGRNESFSSVLKYIQFEYLDCDHLEQFFEYVYPLHVDRALWESITNFTMNSVKKSTQKTYRNMRFVKREEVFEYNSSVPFKGIISRLCEECGGNPHEKGIMNITASSTSFRGCHQVVNYGWGAKGTHNYWGSSDISNSWIQFDFKEYLISPASYTIKTHNGSSKLRQWVIEGSNDASSWADLHTASYVRWNCSYDAQHFSCPQTNSRFFRYIRLRQTGTNQNGDHYMYLSELEFFGIMKHTNT